MSNAVNLTKRDRKRKLKSGAVVIQTRWVLNYREPRTDRRKQLFYERQKDAQAKRNEIIAQIETMTAAGYFRYHDLGEMDTELKQLSVRAGTIRAHDILGAANGGAALSSLTRCRAGLDRFARRVYETDTISATGIGRNSAATLI